MPFRSAYEGCWNCGKKLTVICQRDVTRKKFCSHGCRQKWRFKQGEWSMDKVTAASNTPEANIKKSHRAEKHPNYKKDRSAVKRPITSFEGNQWRKAVYDRDNYTCQDCEQRGGKLNAHHIKPYAKYPDLRFDVDNGITLCLDCHKKRHTNGWRDVVSVSE